MRRKKSLRLLVGTPAAALLALLASTFPGPSAEALHIQHRHTLAAQAFWSLGEGGPGAPAEFISVLAEDFVDQLPGDRDSFSRVEVRTQQFIEGDPTTDEDDKIREILGVAVLEPTALIVDGRLEQATLTATGERFDGAFGSAFVCESSALPPPPGTLPPTTCAFTTLTVSLTSTAVGPVQRESDSSHSSSSRCQSTESSVGKSRRAVAVGSLSLPGGPNLIPGPSDFAEIFEVRTGKVSSPFCPRPRP